MRPDRDVVVIGLGALGSAAAYWASTYPGMRVLGLEQFGIGHEYGASQDVSRIVRLSYHRRDYVRLARRAYACWAEVEAAAGERIVLRTGGLDVGPPVPAPGVAIDLEENVQAMSAEGVPFERLDAAEIMRRFPAWRLPEDHLGLFQPDAGLADPSIGNEAHRRLARANGAELREHARVERLEDTGVGEVDVVLEGGERITAGRVIVAADAWTARLLEPLGLDVPLSVTQEQVSWFSPRAHSERFAPDAFPVWIWMDEPCFYGFPTYAHPGPKIGQDVGGRAVTPETRTFERDEDSHRRVIAFLEARLPDMAVEPFRTKTCLYTLTPDRDFVVDAVPGHPAIQVVLGSAHAYKFASVLGRVLAERALRDESVSEPELGVFRLGRLARPAPAS